MEETISVAVNAKKTWRLCSFEAQWNNRVMKLPKKKFKLELSSTTFIEVQRSDPRKLQTR